jgi:aryl-alcohol dehydrogenase-like predicted oxidoreductase
MILIMSQNWVLDEEPSLEVLKAAYDRGVTTFDTANVYSNGESERLIGKFIQKVTQPDASQCVDCI